MNILRYKGILVYKRMPTVSCTALSRSVAAAAVPQRPGGRDDNHGNNRGRDTTTLVSVSGETAAAVSARWTGRRPTAPLPRWGGS